MALEPYPVNPYRWHAILETADFYQTAEINTRTGEIDSDPQRDVIYKPADTPAVEAAKRTPLGQVYLDWGRGPWCATWASSPSPRLTPPQLAARPPVDHGRVHRPAFCLFLSCGRGTATADRRLAAGFTSWTAATTPAKEWAGACRNRLFCLRWKYLFARWNGSG